MHHRDKFLGDRRRAESALSPHEAETATALHLERLTDYHKTVLDFIQHVDFLASAADEDIPNADIVESYGVMEEFIRLPEAALVPRATIAQYSPDTELYQVSQLTMRYLEGVRAIHILARQAWERLQATTLTGETATLAQRVQQWAQELSPQIWQLYDHPAGEAAPSLTQCSTQIFSSHFYKKYLARRSKQPLQG